MAYARLQNGRRYSAEAPEMVGDALSMISRLRKKINPQDILLVGFDFPIGLPYGYAQQCGITNFLEFLLKLEQNKWIDFYHPAEDPQQIDLCRPFYPLKPGNARQEHLLYGLKVSTMDDLRRQCELAHEGRRAACPLFWTLGGQQVGKAAISGWQSVIQPALEQDRSHVRIWPFDGDLFSLFQVGQTILAETYPAEFYGHLGITFTRTKADNVKPGKPQSGKRSQRCRQENSGVLLEWAHQTTVDLSSTLVTELIDGFSDKPDSEDRFDAVVGLFGMLNILSNKRSPGDPPGDIQKHIEGWILGQDTHFSPM
jgi:hypothetical protein